MAPASARPAGFWIRAVALGIDFMLFALVQFSFGLMAGTIWGARVEDSPAFQSAVVMFTLLFTAAYTTVLHATLGQTVGKSVVGIRVVGVEGELLPLGAAFLRHVAYWISAFTFGFGFLLAALRRDKRALHDLLAGSRVEYLPAPVAAAAPAPEPPAPAAAEAAAPGEPTDALPRPGA